MAVGPGLTEERTTGGKLYTQPEIAAAQSSPELEPDLQVVTDGGPTSTNIVGAPQFEPEALADMNDVDSQEAEAAPPAPAEVGVTAAGLPNNAALDENTGVEVAPLALQEAGAGDADGQGGPTVTDKYEQRVVELEWPQSFRVNGSDSLRIKLKVLGDGSLQPIAEIDEHAVVATPILLTDRYATHTATVTATISAPDFEVEAVNNLTQPLERGGDVEWRWTLKAADSGSSVIALGLSITWTPNPNNPGGETVLNKPIWGQTLQVDINYVFGALTIPQASIAGTALAVVGFVFQVPLLFKILETVKDVLFGRRKKTRRVTTTRSRRR
jgi:hypothetical protein